MTSTVPCIHGCGVQKYEWVPAAVNAPVNVSPGLRNSEPNFSVRGRHEFVTTSRGDRVHLGVGVGPPDGRPDCDGEVVEWVERALSGLVGSKGVQRGIDTSAPTAAAVVVVTS